MQVISPKQKQPRSHQGHYSSSISLFLEELLCQSTVLPAGLNKLYAQGQLLISSHSLLFLLAKGNEVNESSVLLLSVYKRRSSVTITVNKKKRYMCMFVLLYCLQQLAEWSALSVFFTTSSSISSLSQQAFSDPSHSSAMNKWKTASKAGYWQILLSQTLTCM